MSRSTPISCRQIAPYLPAMVDGELTEPLRAAVADHLTTCVACADEVARYRRIDGLIASLPKTQPSPRVLDGILKAVRTTEQAPTSSTMQPAGTTRAAQSRQRQPALLRQLQGTRQQAEQSPRSARWIAALAPTLVAVLLISMSVALFRHIPLAPQPVRAHATPTLAPNASPVAATQTRMHAAATALAFTPVMPSYLPPGTQVTNVTVGGRTLPPSQRYVDVSWAIAGIIGGVHLREALRGASTTRASIIAGVSAIPLGWQVGPYPWRQVQLAASPHRLAIAETRSTVTLELDAPQPKQVGEQNTVVTTLRLISLSMDAPYAPGSINPLVPAGEVLHYVAVRSAHPGDATWRKEVYVELGANATPGREDEDVTADGIHYRDVTSGNTVLRLDGMAHHYQRLPGGEAAQDASILQGNVLQPFYDAHTLAVQGELWLTGTATYHGARMSDYLLVDAPYETHVYVSAATGQAVAIVVDTATGEQPGGPAAYPWLQDRGGCPAYTLVEFLPPGAVPQGTFDATLPPGYTMGSVAPTQTC